MLFRQFVDDDLGCASYLVGDERAGVAAVVDPGYDIDPYLEAAERGGVRLTHVLETHTHADHLSGHGRLALEHGVAVCIHPAAEPAFPSVPLHDGTEVALGDVVVRVLHTPGHRPEHCCFVVSDRSRAPEPWLVLTGDSLFVGEAARPDLAVEARDGAAGLFESLRRLSELADGVEVYPGHVAGSLCGAGMSSKASSTIGFERRFNPALAFARAEDFVAASIGSAAVRPPNLERIVELNRGPFVGPQPSLRRLGEAGDAVVLDVRPAAEFAAGHGPGALNVPLRSSGFATKAAFVVAGGGPVVLRASSPAEADLAARRLYAVGILDVAGYVDGDATFETLAPVDLDELASLVADGAVDVLDVREGSERDAGYIPGSRHVPYRLVPAFADSLAGDRPVVTICETGSRAAIAASVLAAAGVDARPVIEGGMAQWREKGGPVVEFRRCGT